MRFSTTGSRRMPIGPETPPPPRPSQLLPRPDHRPRRIRRPRTAPNMVAEYMGVVPTRRMRLQEGITAEHAAAPRRSTSKAALTRLPRRGAPARTTATGTKGTTTGTTTTAEADTPTTAGKDALPTTPPGPSVPPAANRREGDHRDQGMGAMVGTAISGRAEMPR